MDNEKRIKELNEKFKSLTSEIDRLTEERAEINDEIKSAKRISDSLDNVGKLVGKRFFTKQSQTGIFDCRAVEVLDCAASKNVGGEPGGAAALLVRECSVHQTYSGVTGNFVKTARQWVHNYCVRNIDVKASAYEEISKDEFEKAWATMLKYSELDDWHPSLSEKFDPNIDKEKFIKDCESGRYDFDGRSAFIVKPNSYGPDFEPCEYFCYASALFLHRARENSNLYFANFDRGSGFLISPIA